MGVLHEVSSSTTCPRCGAEPMFPCRSPAGRARHAHFDRIEQWKTDKVIAEKDRLFQILETIDCPACKAPAGETCSNPGGRTCMDRLQAYQ